jgi:pimeloyl-ACP methyl ester carboxylesterase
MSGYLWFRPMTTDFIRYLIWRWTTTATTSKGYVHTGGADIHYISVGNGPAVLLLHGGLSNRLSWFAQLPWLVESACRVVLLDTRGHGESGLGRAALSYRRLAADAIAVLDALGIARADVVGWSDGGNTALMLGLGWPQRVRRIVAISANFSPAGLTPHARGEDLAPSRGLAYWWRRWWTGAGERLRMLEARIKHLWHSRPNLQRSDLRRITAPCLVIVGEADVVSVTHARQMAENLAQGTLDIIAGGHFTPVTHARRVKALIAGFLGIRVPPVNPNGVGADEGR